MLSIVEVQQATFEMIVSPFLPFPQGHRTTRLSSESQMIRESLSLSTITFIGVFNTMIASISYIDRLIIIDIKIHDLES